MGFAVWLDEQEQTVWARGTHEYRPMGTAVIGCKGQLRHRDFAQARQVPKSLSGKFVGFFGSLETVNEYLKSGSCPKFRATPAHLL